MRMKMDLLMGRNWQTRSILHYCGVPSNPIFKLSHKSQHFENNYHMYMSDASQLYSGSQLKFGTSLKTNLSSSSQITLIWDQQHRQSQCYILYFGLALAEILLTFGQHNCQEDMACTKSARHRLL